MQPGCCSVNVWCGAIRTQLPNALCVYHCYCQAKRSCSQPNPEFFPSFPSVLSSVPVPQSKISKQELACLIPAGVWANMDYDQWRATISGLRHAEVVDVFSAETAVSPLSLASVAMYLLSETMGISTLHVIQRLPRGSDSLYIQTAKLQVQSQAQRKGLHV